MERCRVESETTAHLEQQAQLESNPHLVKCLECKETKPDDDMAIDHIAWDFDVGLCSECAKDNDTRIDYGLDPLLVSLFDYVPVVEELPREQVKFVVEKMVNGKRVNKNLITGAIT